LATELETFDLELLSGLSTSYLLNKLRDYSGFGSPDMRRALVSTKAQ